MDAKELRIGNYVDIDNTIQTIDMNIMFDFDEGGWYIDDLHLTKVKPIPLTEEWLLKFGYEKPAIVWIGDKFYLGTYDRDKTLWHCALRKNNGCLCDIRYVHQLQNLYFALTNEELIKQ
jgi:hypothetical protein